MLYSSLQNPHPYVPNETMSVYIKRYTIVLGRFLPTWSKQVVRSQVTQAR